MKKKCKDCDKPVASDASIRCFNCKIKLRKETQRVNKLKYQYHKTPKHRYATYKRGALSRGIEFNITYEEFNTYWNKPCAYCAQTIAGIGLDRQNNNKGYTIDNLVTCCRTCNFMKHTLDDKTFIEHCKLIASNN